ncbi:MAG: CopD family protein [Planctomycetota bacterium]
MTTYLTFKLIHIFGFVLWIGAMMGLSRLLGYHVKEEAPVRQRMAFMEKRMAYFVSLPGLVITLIGGVGMLLEKKSELLQAPWLHIKLTLVFLLIVADFLMQAKMRKIHAADTMPSPAFFKAIHGIIGLMLLAILYFAIFKKPMPSS